MRVVFALPRILFLLKLAFKKVKVIYLSDLLCFFMVAHKHADSVCSFGLASCGVYLAIQITSYAVGSYSTISPLPLQAVYFLLHFPSNRDIALSSYVFT